MEKRGIKTERGNINRHIEITNKRLRQLKRRISRLQNWLDKKRTNDQLPTLADVITNILEQQGEYGLSKLKSAANMLIFLQQNNIQNLDDLDDKFKNMVRQQTAIQQDFKKIDRRLKTLTEHIKHSGNFKQYRSYKVQYEKLYSEYKMAKKSKAFGAKRKAQKALDTANEYYETHRHEITSFETAERYLKDVLQARFDPKKLPPITKWQAEQAELLSQQSVLNEKYKQVKSDVSRIEKIRKTINGIMDGSWQIEITQPQKAERTDLSKIKSISERLKVATQQANEHNAQRTQTPKSKVYQDRGGR